MGDIRVISATKRNILHKVDTCALRFKIKVPLPGLGPALTFVSKEDIFVELYKIVLSRQTRIIKMNGKCGNSHIPAQDVTTYPLHIDIHPDQGFWITWNNNNIKMGVWEDQKPLLVYPLKNSNEIGYVVFNTISKNWEPVEWLVEMPPIVIKPPEYKRFEGGLHWALMQSGKLPEGALIGGFENEPIYIARAHHNNSHCPGKYVPSTGLAYVPWGRKEHAKKDFEILCGYNAQWIKTRMNDIPAHAFIGGRSEVHNEPLYIGRAMHDNKLITGKVYVRYGTCYLPYNGKEIESETFEILVTPTDEIKQEVAFDVQKLLNHQYLKKKIFIFNKFLDMPQKTGRLKKFKMNIVFYDNPAVCCHNDALNPVEGRH